MVIFLVSIILICAFLFLIWPLTLLITGLGNVLEKTVVPIALFGKFKRWGKAGFNWIWPWETMVRIKTLNLQVQQLVFLVATFTEENVDVTLRVSLQYQAYEDKWYEAVYGLKDVGVQIESFLKNFVRALVPRMPLDFVLKNLELIGIIIQNGITAEQLTSLNNSGLKLDKMVAGLAEMLLPYGWKVVATLVTKVDVDDKVKAAMQTKETAAMTQESTEKEAQRKYDLTVKNAEAEKVAVEQQASAERTRLTLIGEGTAAQWKKVAEGINESARMVVEASGGTVSFPVAIELLLRQQGLETSVQMAKGANKVVLIPPNASGPFTNQVLAGVEAGSEPDSPTPPAEAKTPSAKHHA